MKKLLLILWYFGVFPLYGFDGEIAHYLPPGIAIQSPNGAYECWSERGKDGEMALFIRERAKSERSLLYSTMRTLGVAWSPNSRWLAVEDNAAATESVILIFDIGQRKFPLIYQSPVSRDSQDSWEVVKWGKARVRLKKTTRGGKESFKEITLQDQSIRQKVEIAK